MRGVLDTSVMVAFHSINSSSFPFNMSISSITLAELSTGPAAATAPGIAAARLAHLQWVEANFEPIPFDASMARGYGRLSAAVKAAGRQPRRRAADLMIAATAFDMGVPIFTRNADDLIGADELVEVVAV